MMPLERVAFVVEDVATEFVDVVNAGEQPFRDVKCLARFDARVEFAED